MTVTIWLFEILKILKFWFCIIFRPVIFSSVHHLSLFIQTNYGGENTTVYYIGLRGEFSEAHYHGVTICTYEARPNMSDHKGEAFDSVNKSIH